MAEWRYDPAGVQLYRLWSDGWSDRLSDGSTESIDAVPIRQPCVFCQEPKIRWARVCARCHGVQPIDPASFAPVVVRKLHFFAPDALYIAEVDGGFVVYGTQTGRPTSGQVHQDYHEAIREHGKVRSRMQQMGFVGVSFSI